jgi:hypothetical protein
MYGRISDSQIYRWREWRHHVVIFENKSSFPYFHSPAQPCVAVSYSLWLRFRIVCHSELFSYCHCTYMFICGRETTHLCQNKDDRLAAKKDFQDGFIVSRKGFVLWDGDLSIVLRVKKKICLPWNTHLFLVKRAELQPEQCPNSP